MSDTSPSSANVTLTQETAPPPPLAEANGTFTTDVNGELTLRVVLAGFSPSASVVVSVSVSDAPTA